MTDPILTRRTLLALALAAPALAFLNGCGGGGEDEGDDEGGGGFGGGGGDEDGGDED